MIRVPPPQSHFLSFSFSDLTYYLILSLFLDCSFDLLINLYLLIRLIFIHHVYKLLAAGSAGRKPKAFEPSSFTLSNLIRVFRSSFSAYNRRRRYQINRRAHRILVDRTVAEEDTTGIVDDEHSVRIVCIRV